MTAAKEVKKDLREELKAVLGLPPAITQDQKDQAQKDFKAELPEGKLQVMDLKLLRESDRNLRKVFHGIEELAANMTALGRVLSPLLVRPIPDGDTFEIIAGARRFRAAKLAKLGEVPVNVVKMTDAQVAEVMLTENLQRADLLPVEEAEGFNRLLVDHNYSVAQIAAKIGKSRGHVHARIKLLALGPEGRKVLNEGRMDPTVAVALARRGHKEQARALLTICPKGAEAMSSRAALEFLQTQFARTLKSPPFDMKDPLLVPKQMIEGVACGGACTNCPLRSGSTPGLFDDIKGHDTCTFTPCFDVKVSEAWKKSSSNAEAKGADVFTVQQGKQAFGHNNELHQMSDYVLANTLAEGDPKKRTWKQLWSKLNEDTRPALLFIPDRQLKGRECFKRDEILKALQKDQKWAAKQVKVQAKAEPTDDAHWEKLRLQRQARDRVMQTLIEKASADVLELKLPELRIIALTMHSDGRFEDSLARRQLDDTTADAWITTKATGADLQNFIYELAITNYLGNAYNEYSEEAKAMAARLKVDLKAQEKIFAAEIAAIAKADADKKAAEDLMKKAPGKDAAPEAAEAATTQPAEDF